MIQILKYLVLIVLGGVAAMSLIVNLNISECLHDLDDAQEYYSFDEGYVVDISNDYEDEGCTGSEIDVINHSAQVFKITLFVIFLMIALFVFIDHRIYQKIAKSD